MISIRDALLDEDGHVISIIAYKANRANEFIRCGGPTMFRSLH